MTRLARLLLALGIAAFASADAAAQGVVYNVRTTYGGNINSAIAAAKAAGGGTVYLSAGSAIQVTTPVVIDAGGIRLIGDNAGGSIIKADPTNFSSSNLGVVIVNSAAGTIDGVGIERLTIQGVQKTPVPSSAGIYAKNVKNLDIRNCTIKTTAQSGIYVGSSTGANSNVRIESNYIEGAGNRGIEIGDTTAFRIVGNVVNGSGHHAISVAGVASVGSEEPNKNGFVAENVVDRSPAATPPGFIYGGPSCSAGPPCGGLISIGSGSQQIEISNNVLKGDAPRFNSNGITWGTVTSDTTRGIVINGNVVEAAPGNGIVLPPESVASNNVITGAAARGILVSSGGPALEFGSVSITSNLILDANESNLADIACVGISLATGAHVNDALISNNTCRDRRATRRTRYGVSSIGTDASSIRRLSIRGNQLADVLTASLAWGDSATAIESLRLRDNATLEAYRGIADLNLGTSGTLTIPLTTTYPPFLLKALTTTGPASGTVGVLTSVFTPRTGTSPSYTPASFTVTSASTGDRSKVFWELIGTGP